MNTMTINRRRLMSLAPPALALPLLAAACSSSPDPVLYTIPVKPGPVLQGGPKIIQLRDIGLASYLDRREIVRVSEGNKLGLTNNQWWGESLGTMLGRVIAIGLSERLPACTIYNEGGAISADPNAVAAVNLQRLDLDESGNLQLLAQAAVEFNRPKRSAARTFRIVKPVATKDAAGQVAAIADAVAELTDGLAVLLQG
jgi:uncharacterized lipoprotein YmbA